MILYISIKIEEKLLWHQIAISQKADCRQKNRIVQNTRININHEHSKTFGQIGYCKVKLICFRCPFFVSLQIESADQKKPSLPLRKCTSDKKVFSVNMFLVISLTWLALNLHHHHFYFQVCFFVT